MKLDFMFEVISLQQELQNSKVQEQHGKFKNCP